ncbi:Ribose methyltransferase [Modicella reniformis]|uniref:Ribose methyltransferase n=1 Tax=Modicella reniformis TaxID=1440133 RepID=A0A9P6M9L7_9FUNG|nr:Ribose methyltransferase [Modicella reniformis]
MCALQSKLRKPITLYYENVPSTSTSDGHGSHKVRIEDCIKAARDAGVDVVKVSKGQLNKKIDNDNLHEGVVLETTQLHPLTAESLGPVSATNEYELHFRHKDESIHFNRDPLSATEKASITAGDETPSALIAASPSSSLIPSKTQAPVWVVLEDVEDAGVMAEIIKIAWHMGAEGVMYKRARCLEPNVKMALKSGGAMEMKTIYPIQSLIKFIMESQSNGWHVVGAHVTYGSPRIKPFSAWPQEGVESPTILVIGGSGIEITKQIQKKCDSFILVPNISPIPSIVTDLYPPVIAGVALSTLLAGRLKQFALDPNNAIVASERESDLDNQDEDEDEDEPDRPFGRVVKKQIKPERNRQEVENPLDKIDSPSKKRSKLPW